MANKGLFATLWSAVRPATAKNEEGARAYELPPKHALAQYAATGCLNRTFYAEAEMQLQTVVQLCAQVPPEFIAQAAVFARERGRMKDMPALLCAILASRDARLLERIFDRAIDNAKMLRNFVQIVRSGATGRKSLGTLPKRLVLRWLESRTDEELFRGCVGNDPSMADIVKMVHPRPKTKSREAFYGWLIGKEHDAAALPELVREFEAFKRDTSRPVPDVPFQMLTALNLGREHWTAIAKNAPWQMARMNLNTFARHGVFEDYSMAKLVAGRLADPEQVKRSRTMPYQLLTAFQNIGAGVPQMVADALQDAMEVAIANVPVLPGKVYVFPDVSGSMQSPATGFRKGSTTKTRCIDIAALVAAAIVRRNPTAVAMPFETKVVDVRLNPRDSVMTNAAKLAAVGGGGTDCSAPLAKLNAGNIHADLVVYVSDNESWADPAPGGRGTATMHEWAKFKKRNPRARMACIDIQPYGTVQAHDREDILNVGGFSDAVFDTLDKFLRGQLAPDHWVGEIEEVRI